MKIIAFDMDGTIADLYNFDNWLTHLQNEDTRPYEQARPLWDMGRLRDVLLELIYEGWEVRIISWGAKNSSEDFFNKTIVAKKKWLRKHNFPLSTIHIIKYGATKANSIRHLKAPAILVDDNEVVRKGWALGETIDPTSCNLIEELKKLRNR